MEFQIQCNGCQAKAWVSGSFDADTNGPDLDFDKPIEWDDTREDTSHDCDHSTVFTIIDQEDDDSED